MTNTQKLKDTIEQAEKNIAKASEGLESAPASPQEKEVVFLRDFKQYENIMREYRCGDVFFCPKCDSSIICLCDDYVNNNIANSMHQDNPENVDFKKIVLECGNCKYKDILMKFLKSIENRRNTTIWDEAGLVPRPYKPKKPYYYSPLSIAQYKTPTTSNITSSIKPTKIKQGTIIS